MVILGTIAIVAAMIAVGMIVNRTFGIKPEELAAKRPKAALLTTHEIGESPATALRAGDAQLANLRASQRCKDCRTLLEVTSDDEELRYGGEPMRVLRFRCPQCGSERSLYVRPASDRRA